MAQKLGTFRIEKEIKNAEELAELLKKHLDPKFQITVGKADKGVKKFFTGNDVDSVTVRKNAYHGILMGITPRTAGIEYQVINCGAIVPNALLNQVVGHEGILDIAICSTIFGKGKDLYDRFEDVVINELQGQKVNMGLVNQAKALLKGKSVFDTVSDLKDAKEKIEELKEN